jgi:DNA modification methylase
MGLRIEYIETAALQAYGRNARTHSAEQIEQLQASMREFGFTNPVLIDEAGELIAGHGRTSAALALGLEKVPAIRLLGLSEQQKKALRIADNQLALNAGWDLDLLAQEVQELQAADYDLELLGFDDEMLAQLLEEEEEEAPPPPGADADKTPEVKTKEVSKPGMVWQLGPHRVMCGDSTSAADVAKLVAGEKVQLLHADPPYGMGKEGEGVANDNLYREKLDEFQRDWWAASRQFLADNASAYVWGWEHNLCLFYVSILLSLICEKKASHKNWIVWDKKSAQGMRQESMRRFAPATEHCLFFAFGPEEFNTNADGYWDGWDNVRLRLCDAVKAQGWGVSEINRITGTQMGGHWVTKSQWTFITDANYSKLAAAATVPDAFPDYQELRADYLRAKAGDEENRGGFYAARAYFDNTHDTMRDVWEFPRVQGDERHGHATPKPVAMMERVMRSSLPEGGLCLEPFGGSGSTLMGAEKTGRRCYTMELQPCYVDVIVRRWQDYTGQAATLDGDGRTFAEIEAIAAEAVEV